MDLQIPCGNMIKILIIFSPVLIPWKFYVSALPRDLKHPHDNHIIHKQQLRNHSTSVQYNDEKKPNVQKETLTTNSRIQWLKHRAVDHKRTSRSGIPQNITFRYILKSKGVIRTDDMSSGTKSETTQKRPKRTQQNLQSGDKHRTKTRTKRHGIMQQEAQTEKTDQKEEDEKQAKDTKGETESNMKTAESGTAKPSTTKEQIETKEEHEPNNNAITEKVELATDSDMVESTIEPIETEPEPTTLVQVVSETDLPSTSEDVSEPVMVPVEIVTEPDMVESTTESVVMDLNPVAVLPVATEYFSSTLSPNFSPALPPSSSEFPLPSSVVFPRKPWSPIIKTGHDEFFDSESSHGRRAKPSIIRPGIGDSPHPEPDIEPISFSRGLTVGLVLLAMLVLLLSIGLLLFLIWIRRHREPNVNSDLLSRLDRPTRADRNGHPTYVAGSPAEGIRRPSGRIRQRPRRDESNSEVTKPGANSLASKSALRRRQQQHRRARLLAQDALLSEGSRATGSRFRCLSDDSTYYGTGSTHNDPVILTGARRTRVSVESGRRISTQPVNGTEATDATDGYATGDTYLEPPIALMDTDRHMTTTDSEEIISPERTSLSDGTCVSTLEPGKRSRNRGNAWKYIDEN